MPQLLPDGLNDPALEEPVTADAVTYGSSWQFHLNPECDCTDPLLDVPHLAVRGNKVTRTEEADTLMQWITMTLQTDRFKWEVYDNQYGTEFAELIEGSLPEEEAETEIIRAVREAILIDPRVASVTSVDFTEGRSLGNPAASVVEVRVVTYTGELKRLQLDLSLRTSIDAYINS